MGASDESEYTGCCALDYKRLSGNCFGNSYTDCQQTLLYEEMPCDNQCLSSCQGFNNCKDGRFNSTFLIVIEVLVGLAICICIAYCCVKKCRRGRSYSTQIVTRNLNNAKDNTPLEYDDVNSLSSGRSSRHNSAYSNRSKRLDSDGSESPFETRFGYRNKSIN